MRIKLNQIEAQLQSLIEGSAARLFPSSARQKDLASRLVEAMRAGIQEGAGGEPLAPNLYTLQVHPSQVLALQENRALIDGLTQALREASAEAGFRFPGPLVIRVAGLPEIAVGRIQVTALNSLANLTETTDLVVGPPQNGEEIPQDAFLIVDGAQIMPLKQTVINIGRRPDNQIVVEDERVSRLHAQLRAVRGRYVIFDLDSTGGTFVNGRLVQRSTLYPGDVISLAGVPLVFGQDSLGPDETQDYNPLSTRPDQSTSGTGSFPE